MAKTTVRFVTTHWMPRYKEEKTGILRTKTGQKVQDGFIAGRVDLRRLSQDLETTILDLEAEGYSIKNITEITSGKFDYNFDSREDHSYGYGYGYSFTEGLIVSAERD